MTAIEGRGLITREVGAVCGVIFLADVVAGTVFPTFSLFAQHLGVSLAMIGLINTVGGVTQFAVSIPIGTWSDRTSRPRVIRTGAVGFAIATALFALAQGAPMLLVGRIAFAFGVVATFRISAAYLADVTEPERRPLVYGITSTVMGLGFTVGSLLGGRLAEDHGAPVAYVVASGLALSGLVIAWRFLDSSITVQRHRPRRELGHVLQLIGRRDLILVNSVTLLVNVTFIGAIATFFPIYGSELMLSQTAIGAMFATRALVSTLGRVPAALVCRRMGTRTVLSGVLFVELIVVVGIWQASELLFLTALLALDGLAYGAYLVASQTAVAEAVEAQDRGAAMGLNEMAVGIGGTLAPVSLGAIASSIGVRAVFPVTGGVLLIGFVVSLLRPLAEDRQHR